MTDSDQERLVRIDILLFMLLDLGLISVETLRNARRVMYKIVNQ
jgi:hypothetical protein